MNDVPNIPTNILIIAAVLPVLVLLLFIYIKDKHKEPILLLIKLFLLGILSIIPVLIFELILDEIFYVDGSPNVIMLFINVFFSVALVEEGFKWFFTKYFGYNDGEFNEIYDIMVYAVFVSLGFACFENILYVLQNGIYNAIARAFTSIPGHASFAISMGSFMAKAKIASLNGNKKLYNKNIILSILVPTLLHTIYDTFALGGYVSLFLVFDIIMFIFCFISVYKLSGMQVNFSRNIDRGVISNVNGVVKYNEKLDNDGNDNKDHSSKNSDMDDMHKGCNVQKDSSVPNINFCPICGSKYMGGRYCGACGFKIKD